MCAIWRRRPLDDHRRTHLRHKPATSLYHRRQSHNDVGMKMSIIILCATTAAATYTNTTQHIHTYVRHRRRRRLHTQSDIIIYERSPPSCSGGDRRVVLLSITHLSPQTARGMVYYQRRHVFFVIPHVYGCCDCAVSNRLSWRGTV